MKPPLCIDLYCGLGGWAEGFLAEGWEVIGFDIERHRYRSHQFPGQLVLQDVLTLHGSQFRDAACIVASPPCQRYSYMAMPWKRGKREAEWQRWERTAPIWRGNFQLNALFDACWRIQREASEAAGHHVPMVIENVRGAQRWVGPAAWAYGSYFLWGDVPALMPFTGAAKKCPNHDTFYLDGAPCGKLTDPRYPSAGTKNNGGSWFAQAHNTTSGHSRNPVTGEGAKFTIKPPGQVTTDTRDAVASVHGNARRAASALIAKIPFELARHIASVYYPYQLTKESGNFSGLSCDLSL